MEAETWAFEEAGVVVGWVEWKQLRKVALNRPAEDALARAQAHTEQLGRSEG